MTTDELSQILEDLKSEFGDSIITLSKYGDSIIAKFVDATIQVSPKEDDKVEILVSSYLKETGTIEVHPPILVDELSGMKFFKGLVQVFSEVFASKRLIQEIRNLLE